ncbi:MAG: HaeIII family restriction endonuclease [Rickettsia endosymbiont of Labidopullus appendiculatus]|nr:HaeIII family restriction endonuclease [Rickettsia endosymbiont of Labidopullus appendiculatus]
MATQTNNGRAFEWAVGLVLKLQTNMSIEENAYSEINEKAFYEIADREKSDFLNAATIAVEHIMLKEKVFFESGNDGLISFNSDTVGKQGDVRDVLITINGKTFGISCKNNHKALKHPRLSRTANFIKEWGIDDSGCSDEYWVTASTIFDELAKIKNDSNGTALWKDVINKPSRFYWPILDAWSNEISRVCAISETKEVELCKTMISFIVGRFDFYKIIREGRKRVIVQGVNLNNTLSTKRTKHPTCINAINNKNGGQYSKTIVFNRGYSINFRTHNAESKVIPSLKFDITAIGLPANEIYQQTFDL